MTRSTGGRRLLTKGPERLDERGEAKLLSFLEAGDPHGEVRMAWHAEETLRGLYDHHAETATVYLAELVESLLHQDMPQELQQLGRTLRRWAEQIVAWHFAQVSNGPTEAMNSLIKAGQASRVRVPPVPELPATRPAPRQRPNWDLLATITPTPPP